MGNRLHRGRTQQQQQQQWSITLAWVACVCVCVCVYVCVCVCVCVRLEQLGQRNVATHSGGKALRSAPSARNNATASSRRWLCMPCTRLGPFSAATSSRQSIESRGHSDSLWRQHRARARARVCVSASAHIRNAQAQTHSHRHRHTDTRKLCKRTCGPWRIWRRGECGFLHSTRATSRRNTSHSRTATSSVCGERWNAAAASSQEEGGMVYACAFTRAFVISIG